MEPDDTARLVAEADDREKRVVQGEMSTDDHALSAPNATAELQRQTPSSARLGGQPCPVTMTSSAEPVRKAGRFRRSRARFSVDAGSPTSAQTSGSGNSA